MTSSDRISCRSLRAGSFTSFRSHQTITYLLVAAIASVSTAALAADKPPLIADRDVPASTASSVSAAVEFSLSSLDRALERKIPKRLASINDRGSSCWHRRILGRMVNIDCEYSGYVERTGPVSLRAENGRLIATMPLFGTVSGQGIGRFARLLHGTGEGALTVYATSRPRLRPDWSVALDMSEGFRWQEPPVLQILGFRINLTRYIEPIRDQVSRVQRDAAASVAAMNIRGKAEAAWRQMFAPVKIIDSPAVWLTMTPSSVAFSGMRTRGDALEGSIEIAGSTATTIGSEPSPTTPTPLPALTKDVENPGQFAVIVPIDISYDQIREKIQNFTTARAQIGGPGVKEISVYPSAGKIVAGLHLEFGSDAKGDTWIYVTATPVVDANSQTLQFSDLSIAANSPAEDASSATLGNPSFLQDLQQQLSQTFQTEWQAALASANTRLSRPLGNGFRSEGHLASAGLSGISLLPGGIRINLRASGELRILYGM